VNPNPHSRPASRPTVVILAIAASVGGLVFGASQALSASTAPLSGAWTIAPTGKAASSGELKFRVTRNDGSDPVEIEVPVSSGTSEEGVARDIRRSLSSQLRSDRFNVTLGEGANVFVTDQRGEPSFTLELLDSDVENLRVMVQSVQPVAPPTVPEQRAPATPPQGTPDTPAAPGNPAPGNAVPPTPSGSPQTPVTPPVQSPAPAPATPIDAPAPNASGGAAAPQG
jgi:hypothetical protein